MFIAPEILEQISSMNSSPKCRNTGPEWSKLTQKRDNWSALTFGQVCINRSTCEIQLTVSVGSILDDIDKLLLDHRQQEQRAGKTIDPASKDQPESGELDAVMLCHALDRPEGMPNSCPVQEKMGLHLEW